MWAPNQQTFLALRILEKFKYEAIILYSFFFFLVFGMNAQAQQHHMPAMNMQSKDQPSTKNIFLAQMDTLMMHMDTVQQTKNVEVDFLQMMIPHHQGAVQMALYEVAHGTDKEMIQLAKSIIAEQHIEIQMMNALLPVARSEKQQGRDISDRWNVSMQEMMKNMPPENELTNIDTAFAKVMLPHHQAGIDMAKVMLQYGNNKAVKRMAEMIISSQQVEIEQMKQFIQKIS